MASSVAGGAGSGEKLSGPKFKIGDKVYFDTFEQGYMRPGEASITEYAYMIKEEGVAPYFRQEDLLRSTRDKVAARGGLRRRKTRHGKTRRGKRNANR